MRTESRGRFVLLSALIFAFVLSSPAPGGETPPLLDGDAGAVAADLEASLPGLLEKGHVPGLQIAVVRDGKIAWNGAFGVASATRGAGVTSETIFEAASLTKPLFAYFAMKLVDEGVLDLDTPLVRYVPRDSIEKRLGHSVDLEGFRREWLEKITARHALSHCSGLPHGEGGTPYPILFEPGTRYKYSADGYALLQMAVEQRKGRKLETLMKEYVLDPLGMTHSAMVWQDAYETTMASGHDAFGAPQEFRKRSGADAAASLYTTAADYARFVCAVLNGDGLKETTLREMLTPQVVVDRDRGLEWSLGFGLQTDANGTALWQWGDYGIFRNYVIAYPRRKTGVIYLTNSFHGLDLCREIVGRSTGGRAWGVEYLEYPQYDTPLCAFFWALLEQGPGAVDRLLPGMATEHPELLSDRAIRWVVGLLKEGNRHPEITAYCRFMAEKRPTSAFIHAELARSYMQTGDFASAKSFFARSLELPDRNDFDSTGVAWATSYMKAIEEPAALSAEQVKKLAGDYGARHIKFENGRLYYLRDNVASKNYRELIPLSADTFVIREVSYFRVRFEIGPDGVPTGIIGLYEGGGRDESPRN